VTTPGIDIDGVEPAIVGDTLQALLVLSYTYKGELVEPANAVFLRFSNQWHRLYFDDGIICWRRDAQGPRRFEAPEINAVYDVVDIAGQYHLKGHPLAQLSYQVRPNGDSAIHMRFAHGPALTFESISDVASYRCA
jgi:hypothetical protein